MKWARHSDRTHTREKTQCEWEWMFFEQKSTRQKWHRNLLLLLWDVVPKRQRHFAHIHKHIQHSLLLTHWQQNNKRKLSISVFTDSISFYMDSLLWKIIWNRKWMALPFLGVLFLSQSHPLPLAHIALCLFFRLLLPGLRDFERHCSETI